MLDDTPSRASFEMKDKSAGDRRLLRQPRCSSLLKSRKSRQRARGGGQPIAARTEQETGSKQFYFALEESLLLGFHLIFTVTEVLGRGGVFVFSTDYM
jgi:hypothetical protein